MARVQITADVTKVLVEGGRRYQLSVDGATVQIYQKGTTATPTVYDAPTAGNTLAPPFTTDGAGRIVHEDSDDIWVDPQSLDISATADGESFQFQYEAVSAETLVVQSSIYL